MQHQVPSSIEEKTSADIVTRFKTTLKVYLPWGLLIRADLDKPISSKKVLVIKAMHESQNHSV